MTRPDNLAPDDLAPDDRRSVDPAGDDLEAPPEDAAEQSKSANPAEEPSELRRGLEVGEWDAFEQSVVIDLDDEYDR